MADRTSIAASRVPSFGGLVVCLIVSFYTWFGDHRAYVADDAGIALRYAERIAQGRGFGYNDGEAVNGASSPLLVLLEAGLLRAGVRPRPAILGIASVGFGAAAGLLFATFARFYSIAAALFGVLVLLAFHSPYDFVTDGMETPVVGLLVALLFRALHGGGCVFPGVALGLLVANKLDGAIAAIAYTLAFLAARRAFPWRTALVALLTAAPLLLLLVACFGSILPQSMIVKLTLHAQLPGHPPMDPWWMHRLLTIGTLAIPYAAAWCSIPALALTRGSSRTFAVAVMQLWFVIHLLTYSVVDLGDTYPWYAAAPRYLCVILSTFLVHGLAGVMRAPGRRRIVLDPAAVPQRARAVCLTFCAVLAGVRMPTLLARLQHPMGDAGISRWTTWNVARQAAGVWLRKHTGGDELLATFEGLPAFEYAGPCYDWSLLNSIRDDARRATAAYELLGPQVIADGAALPWLQPGTGRQLVASLRFDAGDGFYLLYAAPQSEAWRSGARCLMLPTPALWLVDAAGAAQRLAQDGNAWRIPAQSSSYFDLPTAPPPTLLCSVALARSHGRLPLAGDAVHLSIDSAGAELYSADLTWDAAPTPVHIRLPSGSGSATQRITIDCAYFGSADARDVLVVVREVLVRCGEPPRSADFKLLDPRCAARVDRVADTGLPCRLQGW